MEKDRQQKMTLLANMGCFGKFSGAEQIEYIESFSIRKRTSLLSKYAMQIKEDAPSFKKAFVIDENIAKLFISRNIKPHIKSKYKAGGIREYANNLKKGDVLDIEEKYILSFHNPNLHCLKNYSAKKWLKKYNLRNSILPEMDFTGLSLKGRRIAKVDFTKTNLSAIQWLEAKHIFDCKLPKMDFTGFSLKNRNISGVDFSKTNLKADQWLEAKDIYRCKLPKMNFTGLSLKGRDIYGVDFSHTNLTPKQWLEAKDIYACKVPMDFSGLNLKGRDISFVNFGYSKITREQLLEAEWHRIFFNDNEIFRQDF